MKMLLFGSTACLILLPLCLVAALSGCGARRAAVAPASGTVTYNGEPVAEATVVFMQEGASLFSSGTTDSAGRFTLSTYESGDGAIIGPNKVTVFRYNAPAANAPDTPLTEEYFQTQGTLPAAALPARYARPETTDLLVEVTPAGGEHVLVLKD